MHEYTAIQRIIRTAELAAAENGASKILEVRLVIGDQSGILIEPARSYFRIIGRGTACEGAVLTFETVGSKLLCAKCGQYFERLPFRFDCPFCGGEGGPTDIGREFYIKEIIAE